MPMQKPMDLKCIDKGMGKHIIYLLLGCIGFLPSCQYKKDPAATEIILTNSSTVVLNNKAIAIRRDDLYFIPEGDFCPLIRNMNEDTIPAQLDDLNGDSIWDELFFLMSLDSNTEKKVSLSWIPAPLEFEKRTSVRFGVRSSWEAIVQPADVYLGYIEAPETGNICNTYLAELTINNDKPVEYFAVACWELKDRRFKNEDYFQEYVRDLVTQLETEVKVTIK
jgi:hypothetical protein